MHQGVVDWVRATLLPDMLQGKRLLDVGSHSVNGTMQQYLKDQGAEVWGIDVEPGEAVDEVLDVTQLLIRYGSKKWDIVLCTEMLEHCDRWQEAIYQMKESLVIGGWLILTTRSPGYPFHAPPDRWRFTKEVILEAFEDLADVATWSDPGYALNPQPGVFIRGRRWGPVGVPSVSAIPAPSEAKNAEYADPLFGR